MMRAVVLVLPVLVLTVCFWLLLQVDAEDAHAVGVDVLGDGGLSDAVDDVVADGESVVSKRHETRRQTDQQPQEQQHSGHEQPQHEAAAASRSTLSAEALTAASAPPSA